MHWYSPSLKKAFAVKANALLAADDIEFRLDEKYDRYDWMSEPKKSWADTIKDRCIQLRDENKYLRLWYSGGEDSHTILKCFMDNEIPLDEIGMFRNSVESNFESCPSADEINHYAAPFLNANREKLLGADVKYYDTGYEQYVEYARTFSLLTSNQMTLRFSHLDLLSDFAFPRMNDIDGVINISGVEKPLVQHDNEGFYWVQDDAVLLHYVPPPEIKHLYAHFYLGSLEVQHKQVYMAADAMINGEYNRNTMHSMHIPGRDWIIEKRAAKKGTQLRRSDKALATMRGAMKQPETREVYRSYLRTLNASGLDKKHFNNGNPILFYKGIDTKKYRVL